MKNMLKKLIDCCDLSVDQAEKAGAVQLARIYGRMNPDGEGCVFTTCYGLSPCNTCEDCNSDLCGTY